MSRDKGNGPVKRPRTLKRAAVSPGPLKDLKDLLYEVYLAADAPTLDDIAADIANVGNDDHALTGTPSRDTVHRCISSAELPPKQADAVAIAVVLARRAAWDENDLAMRVRAFWVQARTALPFGQPIREITDPFALEVHRAIEVAPQGGEPLALLPTYVERAHDLRLRQRVSAALSGRSQIVVLVGDSSAGKTRACWEVVQQYPDDWRLWHPIDPSRPDALLDHLESVGRQTVVWLNELQHYLLTPPGDLGERAAAGLRALMRDSTRSPVLILATIWPEHWATLVTVPEQSQIQDPHSQARALLTGNDIPVASCFAEFDLKALVEAAGADARIDYAFRHAEQGQITQYLAGAPALLERYFNAPMAARAIIAAAMDIRRLGHGIEIPYSLIEDAAESYLNDQQWDQLQENWLEDALSYATQPIRGARGPLSRIRPRRKSGEVGGPRYRLADYLEQYGREARGDRDLPVGLWESLLDYAEVESSLRLAEAAIKRKFLRIGVAFCRKAAIEGDREAFSVVARTLWSSGRQDEAIDWYRAAVTAGAEGAVNAAANSLWQSNARPDALAWLEEMSRRGDSAPLAYAGDLLWRAGQVSSAIDWYRKAASAGDGFAEFLDCAEAEPDRVEDSLIRLEKRASDGDVSALSLAGKLLEEEGRRGDAVRYYAKAVLEGDMGAVSCLITLGAYNREWFKRHTDYGEEELEILDARFTPTDSHMVEVQPEFDYGIEPDGTRSSPWVAAIPEME